MKRTQKQSIIKDLSKKMVFLSGPRQVGKTWLAKEICKEFKEAVYLNYDDFEQRKIIQARSWLPSTELIVFDELHKMSEWKNYLKGLYDTKPEKLKILVTGSARLETYRFVGDSLAGRYYHRRLLPFSLAELNNPKKSDQDKLIVQGGFPEPFLASSTDDANRWRIQYAQGLIRFDVLDFEKIQDLKSMQLVLEILRRNAGTPVSYKSIAEDVSVSPHTIKKYIQILEELMIVFRVTPYSKNIARSLLKEPKIYFFDTGMVIDSKGARFENFVAVSLLKNLYEIQDSKGIVTELKYLRTKEGKEVDFCAVIDGQIKYILEAKVSSKKTHSGLKYFVEKYGLTGIQLVQNISVEQKIDNVTIRDSFEYLR